MKNYNEMTDAVFRRRDEFLAAQKKKKGILLKAGVPACSLLLVALIGVGIWQGGLQNIPSVPPTDPTEITTSAGVTEDSKADITEATEPSATDPTEKQTEGFKKPVGNIDGNTPSNPGVNGTLPPDPPEKPTQGSNDSPSIDGDVDWDTDESTQPPTANIDEATGAPGAAGRPDETPTIVVEPTTAAPMEPWGPDQMFPLPWDPTLPTAPCTVPGMDDPFATGTPTTQPTTVAPTGPLMITCGGETYEAQIGDVITYTAELYMDAPFESFQCAVEHSSKLQVVEWIDPTEDDPAPQHFPNLTGGSAIMNYHYNRYNGYGVQKVFVTASNIRGYNFTEKKVLVTYDFVVAKPGEEEIKLHIDALNRKGDEEPYFKNGQQLVFEGVELSEYLTVTPKDEAVLPTEPDSTAPSEPAPTAPPFTYPEESAEGDMIINCDGRTYSANVGDTVTYVMEIWAADLFEDFQGYMEYGEGGLQIIDRTENGEAYEAAEISTPNLTNALVNYYTGSRPDGWGLERIPYSANVTASSISPGYNFRDRKILIQLEFVVTEAGEKDFDMYIVTMGRRKDGARYFENDEQFIFDGIEVYEYVLVNNK